MLQNRVKCAVPNPGVVAVGSTITLGAAPVGFRSWLAAFGGAAPAYFVLSDGAGRALSGVWTVNATTPETATITEVLANDRLGGTAGETFSSACTAFNAVPSQEVALLRSSPMAGLRNLVINANPIINQRAYASGAATVVANQYTLDRWRVVTSGQAVSWSDSVGVRTVTAPAGGMEQVIEGTGLIGGPHTLNWNGTATATVNGATVAKRGQVVLQGGTNATLRLTGGSWDRVQLEMGPLATPFEFRPQAAETVLCQRYYENGTAICGYPAYTNATIQYVPMRVVRKRATPTVGSSGSGLANIFSAAPIAISPSDFYFDVRASAAGNCAITLSWAADAEL